MIKLGLAALIAAAAILPAHAEDVPATIIAMERTALDASDKGDVRPFLAISAPDVVYQDPALTKPIVGLPALTAYYAKFPATAAAHGVMSDTQVQVFDAMAVLSFHYVVSRDNAVLREWNCTEVYRKTAAGWRIVNTHWSLSGPLVEKLF
jgi:hypothetical protein